MQPQLLTVVQEETLRGWSPEEWAKWWIERKRDGFRAIFRDGKFWSRTGKPLHNLGHIEESLKGYSGWVFDGEIYGTSWAETSSIARASKTVKANGLKFFVFDGMRDADWLMESCDATLTERRSALWELLSDVDLRYVEMTTYWQCRIYEEFQFLHNANLATGCDGTVLKFKDSLYEFKRTRTWLKVKPVETYDGKVIGMYEGRGKYAGMLGGLIVNFDGVETNVSGMTDAQRGAWWRNDGLPHDSIIGKTIEVSARGKHPSGCLIEPRFERIREDK